MSGIVVCVHPRAAEEGAKILEAGGNAFDAAIATAFVQMIVTPFSCGIGGMVSAHILSREHDTHAVVDGCLRAGSRVTADMWVADYRGEGDFNGESLFEDFRSTMGYTSICTPGAVAALGEVQRRFSTMPWRDLLQPAIRVARQGFPVLPGMTQSPHDDPEPFKPTRFERLNATPDCAALYLRPDGSPFLPDDRLRNPTYADTLEQLAARGADDFYHGELAERISADLAANGAFVTRDDLAAYRAGDLRPPCYYLPRLHGLQQRRAGRRPFAPGSAQRACRIRSCRAGTRQRGVPRPPGVNLATGQPGPARLLGRSGFLAPLTGV